MQVINFARLLQEKEKLKEEFNAKSPFHYIVIDNFLNESEAEKILSEYPLVDKSKWVDANGLHTNKKWAKPCIENSVAANFYNEVNSQQFRDYLGEVTCINSLLADKDLNGAGYHQILDGGFLNIHIDFNLHNNLDRRLNLIVYLNKDWQENYGGYLELWDMQKKQQLENIAPVFNRCVVFETNEISYHGHPVPLKTNGKTTRKSLSVYYYTEGRDDIKRAAAHNTIYVNTRGFSGGLRIFLNGLKHVGRKISQGFKK